MADRNSLTLKSLTSAQHDGWGMRTALLARGLSTVSLPGDMVFTESQEGPRLGFTQLCSSGTTYAGMGQTKTLHRTWESLRTVGMSAPRHRTFQAGDRRRAAIFARRMGFPVMLSSPRGGYRRVAHTLRDFLAAFREVSSKNDDGVLISETRAGDGIRLLVQDDQVLAAAGRAPKDRRTLEDVPANVKALAVDALQAVPGLGLGSITIAMPVDGASNPPVVEKIRFTPHLRPFAHGSRRAAVRLADLVLEGAAKNVGADLPEKRETVTVGLRFHGVAAPHNFAEVLEQAAAHSRLNARDTLRAVSDGAEATVTGSPQDIALLITASIIGLEEGLSSHMVTTHPFEE